MARTLFLHIGAHRTATSAIQKFLHGNYDRLVSHGILQVNGVPRQAKLMQAMAAGRRQVPEVVERINRQIEDAGHEIHSAILTDEDICCQRDLSYLAPFREHFDVKVIYTLRRQDLWLESWYYQNIKWQWQRKLSHLTFPEFMDIYEDFHWIHYDTYIGHLEALFGQENILLTVHEKAHMPGGPIATFCRHLGLTDLEGFTIPGQVNPSFTAATSEFMRQLPLDQAAPRYRAEFEHILHDIDRKLRKDTAETSSLLLTRAERETLLAEFEPGNTAVAERYFGRSQLFEEALPPAEAPLADMSLPDSAQELMDRFILPLVRGIAPGISPQNLMDYLAIPFVQAAIYQHKNQDKGADQATEQD